MTAGGVDPDPPRPGMVRVSHPNSARPTTPSSATPATRAASAGRRRAAISYRLAIGPPPVQESEHGPRRDAGRRRKHGRPQRIEEPIADDRERERQCDQAPGLPAPPAA